MVGIIIPMDYRRIAEREMGTLKSDQRICAENKELIRAFTRDRYAEGLSHARVAKYTGLLRCIAIKLNKPFPQVDIDDIKELIRQIELSDRSACTKRDYRVAVKIFWRWMAGQDDYPDSVKWIKGKVGKNSRKLPSEMLTESDIAMLTSAAKNPRDRAIVAVLWETGCRAGELLTLKIKSFKGDGDLCTLDVSGKTGQRRIPIVACVPHLTKWLSFHPEADEPESPVWPNLGIRGRTEYMTYSGLQQMLKKLAERVGFKKRVHPHLFRHSRATFLANRLTEAQMKQFFGWTQGSDMAVIYVHLSGRDIQDSILQMYGKGTAAKPAIPEIVNRPCPRCGFDNASDSRFCGRCGSPTSDEGSIALSQKLQIYDQLLTALLSDKRVVDILDRRLDHDPSLIEKLKQLG